MKSKKAGAKVGAAKKARKLKRKRQASAAAAASAEAAEGAEGAEAAEAAPAGAKKADTFQAGRWRVMVVFFPVPGVSGPDP